MRRLLLLFLLVCPAAPAAAQTDTIIGDRTAVQLLQRARAARVRNERPIRSYTAIVSTRMAGGMRLPMRDRMIVREEAAAKVRWSRDDRNIIQMRAGREQNPGGIEPNTNLGVQLHDPGDSRLYFGFGVRTEPNDSNDYWIEHPLGDRAEQHYRYESGDTLTLTLEDGATLRSIELRAIPLRDDPHTVRGVLWIEPVSGALAQAAFRLARTVDLLRDTVITNDTARNAMRFVPGFFKPFEFDISLVTIDYSLWDMKHWMPRNIRFEGLIRFGALQFPGAFETSYDLMDVLVDADATTPEPDVVRSTVREWAAEGDYIVRNLTLRPDTVQNRRRPRRRPPVYIVPRDRASLMTSEELPPPIWENAPGFLKKEELQAMEDRLAKLSPPRRRDVPLHFGWGLGEPEMVRYNRIEALSLGARLSAILPFADVNATVRLGAADLHPNADLLLRRASVKRTLDLRLYHDLATADESRRALGMGNSLSALLLGRDEGEYYRATGAATTLAPALTERRSWDFTIYAEQQTEVARETHIALPRMWNDSVFRSNIVAGEAFQQGALLRLRPWWGGDPTRAQFGIDLMVQGEMGDFEHARGRLTLRSSLPLGPLKFGAEAGVATSTGDVPAQRLFYLGGASTLRGYEPNTVRGTSAARGRIELARKRQAGSLVLFSDWGWAGNRADINDARIRAANERLSAGIGASVLDGIIRIDLARSLKGPRSWRLDLHMDALM